ncbi:hypothetical protein F4677DRAFT_443209 [Hypoxylon crocopeplum]|nr:hypothetical protein F4677DRAFT_443209 [Hypoxylon crocopeplum]
MSLTGVQAIALVTGAFLSGAMMSVSFVAVPAMLDTTIEASHLRTQWARLYHYGHHVLPAIAVGTCLLHMYTALSKGRLFALAGITTVGIAPFTWVFMAATNVELFRLGAQPLGQADMSRVRELVVKWTWLHVARSLLPLVGAIIALS